MCARNLLNHKYPAHTYSFRSFMYRSPHLRSQTIYTHKHTTDTLYETDEEKFIMPTTVRKTETIILICISVQFCFLTFGYFSAVSFVCFARQHFFLSPSNCNHVQDLVFVQHNRKWICKIERYTTPRHTTQHADEFVLIYKRCNNIK